MPLQTWIYDLEVGAGARWLRIVAGILAFIALAAIYDKLCFERFSSEEAMESAQLARNLAEGKGYTTDSIRPLALALLVKAADPGQSSKVLAKAVPDLSNPPVFPCLLAALMKVLPFKFNATQVWTYQPDLWISVANQFIYYAAVLALFFLARRLFDARVAWLAAALFAGTKLYWRFSVSGLSTMWLILIFLVLVWVLAELEKRSRETPPETEAPLVPLALAAGALVGLAGLSRYAMAWLIVPVLGFVGLGVARDRFKLFAIIAAVFLIVLSPWLARNFVLSGHCLGTAAYAVAEGTAPFPGDTLERSTDPAPGMTRVGPGEVADKFLANARDICGSELPKFGGNWISAFFLVGLLIPFRNEGLKRVRLFLVGSILLLFVVEALERTHLSEDRPEINSENLLAVVAPLAFVFGAALFHTLLDQLELPPAEAQVVAVPALAAVLCAPLLFSLFVGVEIEPFSPYSPAHIQETAHLLLKNEALTSDIPSGVAWYGGRSCVWLPLNDENEFFRVDALKPIHALFLTQMTTDKRYLSEMKEDERGWANFVLECSEQGRVPPGFPLQQAPAPRGFLPDQLFLSDKVRWQTGRKAP